MARGAVSLSTSPGCSKLDLSLKDRIAIEMPERWVQRGKSCVSSKGVERGKEE